MALLFGTNGQPVQNNPNELKLAVFTEPSLEAIVANQQTIIKFLHVALSELKNINLAQLGRLDTMVNGLMEPVPITPTDVC